MTAQAKMYPDAKYGGKCSICGTNVLKGTPIWIGSNRRPYCTAHGLPEILKDVELNPTGPVNDEPCFEDDLISTLKGIEANLLRVAAAIERKGA